MEWIMNRSSRTSTAGSKVSHHPSVPAPSGFPVDVYPMSLACDRPLDPLLPKD
jgi:hypothetical protein